MVAIINESLVYTDCLPLTYYTIRNILGYYLAGAGCVQIGCLASLLHFNVYHCSTLWDFPKVMRDASERKECRDETGGAAGLGC